MQVLKFGGTSVANADNIKKVLGITKAAIQHDRSIVVVSALGGVTDLLLDASLLAAEGREMYRDKLALVQQRHIDCVKQLISPANQQSLTELVINACKELYGITIIV